MQAETGLDTIRPCSQPHTTHQSQRKSLLLCRLDLLLLPAHGPQGCGHPARHRRARPCISIAQGVWKQLAPLLSLGEDRDKFRPQ